MMSASFLDGPAAGVVAEGLPALDEGVDGGLGGLDGLPLAGAMGLYTGKLDSNVMTII